QPMALWEEASAQEVAEFRAHDRAVAEEIGQACIEVVLNHDQQAVVTFTVSEGLVGGIGKLSHNLQGLKETISLDYLSLSVIEDRFGMAIAEAFQMWHAMQEDTDHMVRNVAEGPMFDCEGDGRASSSTSSTVDAEQHGRRDVEHSSLTGAEVAHIEGHGEHSQLAESEQDGPVEGTGDAEVEEGHAGSTRSWWCRQEDPILHYLEVPAVLRVEMDSNLDTQAAQHMDDVEGNASAALDASLDRNAVDMDVDPGMSAAEPYVVPSAWQRVLAAWNDPAIGAGLPDSALSHGDFQHGAGPTPSQSSSMEDDAIA
ncbi:unnamed protein product, partial [Symbiodinium pilosum]